MIKFRNYTYKLRKNSKFILENFTSSKLSLCFLVSQPLCEIITYNSLKACASNKFFFSYLKS